MIGNARGKPDLSNLELGGFVSDELLALTDYLGGRTKEHLADPSGRPSLLDIFVLCLGLIAWSMLPAGRGWI